MRHTVLASGLHYRSAKRYVLVPRSAAESGGGMQRQAEVMRKPVNPGILICRERLLSWIRRQLGPELERLAVEVGQMLTRSKVNVGGCLVWNFWLERLSKTCADVKALPQTRVSRTAFVLQYGASSRLFEAATMRPNLHLIWYGNANFQQDPQPLP